MSGPLIILGPQRPESNLSKTLDAHAVTGHVALITAGWRWDEGEIEELAEQAGRPVHHLPLYHWFERVMAKAPELSERYSERQRRIKAYKKLYRIRLHSALAAVRTLREADGPTDLVVEELTRALYDVRRIDEDVMRSLARIREDFPEVTRPWDVPEARRRHEEAKAVLEKCDAVAIAGGHVAVLRNRLFFFGFEKLLQNFLERDRPLIAWSAGAMALASRIVLFYDDPPDGPGDAEVLDTGLGLLGDLVLFPHAGRRLRLDRPERMGRLAMRFAPAPCLGLECGARLERRGDRWVSCGDGAGAMQFEEDGAVVPLEAS